MEVAVPTYTQKNSRAQLITPLGDDVLLLRGFHGHEGISRLFQFDLEMYSENRSIDYDSIVGKRAIIKISLADGPVTFFNGVVNSFTQGGTHFIETDARPVTLAVYRATLVPWTWLLTCSSNCRIFQEKTIIEIIQHIFDEKQLTDYSLRLHGNYPKREYCVQYRESDFNFISRLMEEEGIFYFFEHQKNKHTLVLADALSEYKPCPLRRTVYYRPQEAGFQTEDLVKEWNICQEIRPGTYTHTDFNFETPTTNLKSQTESNYDKQFELYDFPGKYSKTADGVQLSRVRLEEEQTPRTQIEGSSNCLGFVSCFTFELKDFYRKDKNKTYLLTSITHDYDQANSFRSSREPGASVFEYTNRFQCIPSDTLFRAPRTTPVPVVHGTQTAIVVGPHGEEIYTDDHARVKVQFHWDRLGKNDEKSSCWIRVSQNWAGTGWGVMMIPRIGQEVVVDFLEGDPDRPIITGRVYNGLSTPPYPLPAEKTKSTIKSNSSLGGGGFNEIRFEDKKGDEQLFMQAEKDMDLRVKNDRREWIGQDRHLIVVRDKFEEIDRDSSCTIKQNESTDITGDQHLKIKGKQAVEITGTQSLKVSGDVAEKFEQNHHENVGMNLYLQSGMNLVIEAGVGITLKVGGNFITLNTSGVQIQGTMVLINSGGMALSGQGGSVVSPKAPAQAMLADKADPGSKEPTYKNQIASMSPVQLGLLSAATFNPNAATNQAKTHYIEIELLDDQGKPVPGEAYTIVLPDGSASSGTLDEKGRARIDGIDPGTCKVTFPGYHKDDWKRS
jgi:type VI secretion system secreted protein VgrG